MSFLSNLIGENTYYEMKKLARVIVPIGTCIIAILFGLTFVCHYSFISNMFSLVTGTSLLFIGYIAILIITLDFQVDMEVPVTYSRQKPKDIQKPEGYYLTAVWGIVLIILGIMAIYFSNKYKKEYAFECSTFLVDHQARIYHLDWDNDCEFAAESNHLEKMKGYQIDKSYTFCEWCKEWAEDAEMEYDLDVSI